MKNFTPVFGRVFTTLTLLLMFSSGLAAQTSFAAIGQRSYFEVSQKASAALEKYRQELPPYYQLGESRERRDETGRLHLRVDILLHGLPVKGRQITVHETGPNQSMLIAPNLDPAAPDVHSPKADQRDQEKTIRAAIGTAPFKIEDRQSLWVPHNFKWAAQNYWVKAEQLDVHQGQAHYRIYLHAETAELIFVEDRVCTLVPGNAVTRFSGIQEIETDAMADGSYRLLDKSRGLGIHTRHSVFGEFIDFNNYWNNGNAANDDVATDVHWGMGVTYDWFLNNFNRDSYDNNGLKMDAYLYDGFGNAFWNSESVGFGEGTPGSDFDLPFTSIDVVGHEVAHGMTEYDSGLIYSGESGGLNEAFSDMIGMTIQGETLPEQLDWKLGNDFSSAGLFFRNMANPNEVEMPSTYGGVFWSSNLEVHSGSSIANLWYYFLVEGGNGTNDLGVDYDLQGFGFDTARTIAYHTWTYFLSAASDYHDAAALSLAATGNLYGNCSPVIDRVAAAWRAVGVIVDEGDNLGLNADRYQVCHLDRPVSFGLSGQISTINWDFGDGTTSEEFLPNHLYEQAGEYTVTATGTTCSGNFSLELPRTINVDPTMASCDTTIISESAYGVITDCEGILAGGQEGRLLETGAIEINVAGATGYQLSLTEAINFEMAFIAVYGDFGNGTFESLGSLGVFGDMVELEAQAQRIRIRLFVFGSTEGASYALNWTCLEPRPPVAAFSYFGDVEGCQIDLFVDDESTGSPETWSWTANGQEISTERGGIIRLPNVSGVYDIGLTVCNSVGCDTYTEENLYSYTPDDPACSDLVMEEWLILNSANCTGRLTDHGGPDGDYTSTFGGVNIAVVDAEGIELVFSQFDLVPDDEFNIRAFREGQMFYNEFFQHTDLANSTLSFAADEVRIILNSAGESGTAPGFIMDWSCLQATIPEAIFTGDFEICERRILMNSSSTGFPDSLHWYLNGALAGIGNNPVLDVLEPGTYEVQLVACNDLGCDTATVENFLTYTDQDFAQMGCILATNDWDDSSILLFPNPTKGEVNITGLVDEWYFKVANLQGQQQGVALSTNGSPSIQLNLSNLPSGIYFVTGIQQSTGRIFTRKVVR